MKPLRCQPGKLPRRQCAATVMHNVMRVMNVLFRSGCESKKKNPHSLEIIIHLLSDEPSSRVSVSHGGLLLVQRQLCPPFREKSPYTFFSPSMKIHERNFMFGGSSPDFGSGILKCSRPNVRLWLNWYYFFKIEGVGHVCAVVSAGRCWLAVLRFIMQQLGRGICIYLHIQQLFYSQLDTNWRFFSLISGLTKPAED